MELDDKVLELWALLQELARFETQLGDEAEDQVIPQESRVQ